MGRCRRGVLLAGVLTAGVLLRRVALRSGVTDGEVHASLPGDEILPHAMVEWTRGTTIQARPSQIWPWLVQMGYGRGGWYTNLRVDHLVWGTDTENADEIVPEFLDLTVGDVVPDGPEHAAYFWVRRFDPNHAIVYHSIRHPYRRHPIGPADPVDLVAREQALIDGGTYVDFSWAFVLHPNGPEGTRLLIRTRADYAPKEMGLAGLPLGLVDAYHAQTMLQGIRRRAEAHAGLSLAANGSNSEGSAVRTVGWKRHPAWLRAQGSQRRSA